MCKANVKYSVLGWYDDNLSVIKRVGRKKPERRAVVCIHDLIHERSRLSTDGSNLNASTLPYFSGGVLARLFPTALGKLRRKRYKGVVGNNLEKEKCAGNHGKANKQEVTAGDLPHLNPLLSKKSIT